MDAVDQAMAVLRAGGLPCRMVAIQNVGPVKIALPLSRTTPGLIQSLKSVLLSAPGERPVHLELVNGEQKWHLELLEHKIALTPAIRKWLQALVGPGVVD